MGKCFIIGCIVVIGTCGLALAQTTNCCPSHTYCDCFNGQGGQPPHCCMVQVNGQLPLVADVRTGNQITIPGQGPLGFCTAVFEEWLESCSGVTNPQCQVIGTCLACQAPTSCTYWVHLNPACRPVSGSPPTGSLNYTQACAAYP